MRTGNGMTSDCMLISPWYWPGKCVGTRSLKNLNVGKNSHKILASRILYGSFVHAFSIVLPRIWDTSLRTVSLISSFKEEEEAILFQNANAAIFHRFGLRPRGLRTVFYFVCSACLVLFAVRFLFCLQRTFYFVCSTFLVLFVARLFCLQRASYFVCGTFYFVCSMLILFAACFLFCLQRASYFVCSALLILFAVRLFCLQHAFICLQCALYFRKLLFSLQQIYYLQKCP